MADEEEQGYRWEGKYERTWEALQEDPSGSLEKSVQALVNKAKRKLLLERRSKVRLGLMRHVYVVVDLSFCMGERELGSTKQQKILARLQTFVENFFDQNPLAQVGIIVAKNKRAEKICELTGNTQKLNDALRKTLEIMPVGEFSLQNSLEVALTQLRHMPSYSSREILVVVGSLSTCDPSNLNATIEILKKEKVRCSLVSLTAEVWIYKKLCNDTGGTHNTMLDETHLTDILAAFTRPLPLPENFDCNMVKMGFPSHKFTGDKLPSMCMCHQKKLGDMKADPTSFTNAGYFCPQCQSKYCELPVDCKVCGLTLVSAPHLARSYYHLMPIKMFSEVELTEPTECFACGCSVDQKSYNCEECEKSFCVDCDVFIHDTLNTCPGCTSGYSNKDH